MVKNETERKVKV